MTRLELEQVGRQIADQAEGLGLEKVVIRGVIQDEQGQPRDSVLSISLEPAVPRVAVLDPSDEPIRTLSDYDQKVVRMRQRGLTYPYEIVRMLTARQARTDGDLPPGVFTELDLDKPRPAGRSGPPSRPQHGQHRCRHHP